MRTFEKLILLLIQTDGTKMTVVILEDLNFFWAEEELTDLSFQWSDCKSIQEIADYFKRDPDEILVAIIHLAREDKITARKGGVIGGSSN
ncbi:MAG: hypothetical protein K0S80_3928 [Neobacillus sp.]|nr:hypothetical protein [Neobacillus sp.]